MLGRNQGDCLRVRRFLPKFKGVRAHVITSSPKRTCRRRIYRFDPVRPASRECLGLRPEKRYRPLPRGAEIEIPLSGRQKREPTRRRTMLRTQGRNRLRLASTLSHEDRKWKELLP